MTVASNTPYNQYSATAGQTVFNYTFEITEQTDILVYQRGQNDSPDDVADLLVLNVDYTVAGVGNENGGTITLLVGATLNDVVTLKQDVPVERDSSFTNGGVLRAQDLNNEYDAQMLTQQVTRFNEQNRMLRYPDSSVLTKPKDLVLPVLQANQIFAMNNDGNKLIAYDVPSGGGVAPDNATYLLQTANAELPDSQALSLLATGFVQNTTATGVQNTRTLEGTADQIGLINGDGAAGNPRYFIADNAILPGMTGMGIPAGTTAQRIIPTFPNIALRYNTDIDQIEYYDHILLDWEQIQSGGDVTALIARLAAHTAGDGASMIGLQDQGAVINKTAQDFANLDIICETDPTATLVNGKILSDLALLLAGGIMSGAIDMASNNINNLPIPTLSAQAATKGYVDGIVFNVHPAANYGTIANLAGYAYDNGLAGVGATLTAGSNGAFSTDGKSPALNDRILVKDQTTQAENGLYTLSQVGDASNPAILTRANDYNQSGDMDAGDEVAIVSGDTLAGSKWMMTQTATITVGTTAITWIDISVPNNLVTIDGTQTITGTKTFVTPNIGAANGISLNLGASTLINGFIDDDTFASASATTGATSESIKALVDTFASQVVQYKVYNITSGVSTTVVIPTYVSTGLTGTITPTSASNLIVAIASGEGKARFATPGSGTATITRIAQFRIQRTSGTAEELAGEGIGRILTGGASTLSGDDFNSVCMVSQEIAGTTSAMTYDVQFAARHAGTEAVFGAASGTNRGVLILLELKV